MIFIAKIVNVQVQGLNRLEARAGAQRAPGKVVLERATRLDVSPTLQWAYKKLGLVRAYNDTTTGGRPAIVLVFSDEEKPAETAATTNLREVLAAARCLMGVRMFANPDGSLHIVGAVPDYRQPAMRQLVVEEKGKNVAFSVYSK